ncbi:helix-turn-helix domain-containing protein [Paenibacillus sp. HWE-109]|uniref:helix-turn-helix domain-containing protein n=1 Tax=Paenibacillus sp. HWE-109 TaxID=1306526 RepID=UPI001EDEBFE6|nr:helix-turn-helix domain-containing protein [Paenibacillus sp. HWE-109]UKS29378.1 helix-turn-helix domain-containing protein [Paenibacillus sp. HWE-109]
MRKKWRNRLVFAYLPVFILVIVVLLWIFFVTMSELSKQQALKANEIYAENTMQYVDSKLRTVEQYIVQTFLDDQSVIDFYNVSPLAQNRYLNDRDVYKKLILLRDSFSEIDSVYLYRTRDQIVLSDSSMMGLEQFANSSYLHTLLAAPPANRWSIGREYLDNSGVTTPVVSLIMRMPLPLGTDGVLVANIKLHTLSKLIDNVSRSKFSYLHLLDARGEYIIGDDTISGAASKNREDVTVIKSEYTGWTIRSGFVDGVVFRFLSNLNAFWMVIGILTVLAGAAWIVYVSRQNYKPIESLLERLSSVPLQRPHILAQVKHDEFKIIDNLLDHLLEQFGKYRLENDENFSYRRRYLFEELLTGTQLKLEDGWDKELSRFGFQESSDTYRVAILEIDKYSNFTSTYTNKDQYLIKFIIDNVVQELSQNAGILICPEWIEKHRLCVVCQMPNELVSSDLLHEIMRKTVDWVQTNAAITITCGLGTKVSSLQRVSSSYEEALEALSYKTTFGISSVIDFKNITTKSGEEIFRSLPSIRELVQLFRIGDPQWEQHYKTLFGEIRIQLFSREQVVNLMNYLLFHFYKEMSGLSPEYLECWREYALNPINEWIASFDAVDELEHELHAILQDACHRLDNLRAQRSQHDLIDQVKAYIEVEFNNPDFSLVMLSDRFKLTPNYLSRLFKEEFGEKFIDYLAGLRIEQAKHLLVTTTTAIQEIAVKVGYTHTFSFIRVFKKIVGRTPGDYRKEFQ